MDSLFGITTRMAGRGRASIAPQELVDTGFGARRGVYAFDDHRAIELAFTVARRQRTGDDNRAG